MAMVKRYVNNKTICKRVCECKCAHCTARHGFIKEKKTVAVELVATTDQMSDIVQTTS